MPLHEFLTAWRETSINGPNRIMDRDAAAISSLRASLLAPEGLTWNDFIMDPRCGARGDKRLHLSLMPIPFLGNLEMAKVVVLLQNPGLSPTDYFGEFQVSGFRDLLNDNLRGELSKSDYPFLFLNPAVSWHGGFKWWNDKLSSVINSVAATMGTDYASARHLVANRLASIELVPYHSETFGLPTRWVEQLPSALLARRYLHDVLAPRAKNRDVRVVVTRQVERWGLEEQPFMTLYPTSHARGASLSTDSAGGKAILKAILSP